MAKSDDPSKTNPPAAPPAAQPDVPAGTQQPQRTQVSVDDAHVAGTYANFCRVTGTPEELILDFGLNAQPFGTPNEPLHITQRLIVNFYTAKRMAAALQMALQRHEAAFGVLETDVQKRVRPGAGQPAPQTPQQGRSGS